MPSNEFQNPYPVSNPLHTVFENGDPELKAALLADVMQTQNDRFYAGVREHVSDLADKVKAEGLLGAAQSMAQANADPYAPTAWGKPSEEDFVCPSGQVCLVRRVDVMDLLGGGLLNSVDFLTEIVKTDHIPNATRAPGQAAADAAGKAGKAVQDPEQFGKFAKSVDGVVLRVVAKPELHPVPPEGAKRINGRVYIDSVSTSDKFAIFNYVISGKKEAEEIAQFRDETGEPMGAVEPVADVQLTTVELPRDDGQPAS